MRGARGCGWPPWFRKVRQLHLRQIFAHVASGNVDLRYIYTGREGSQGGGERVTSGLSEIPGGGGRIQKHVRKERKHWLQKTLFSIYILLHNVLFIHFYV
jgi:hypothetical protein